MYIICRACIARMSWTVAWSGNTVVTLRASFETNRLDGVLAVFLGGECHFVLRDESLRHFQNPNPMWRCFPSSAKDEL